MNFLPHRSLKLLIILSASLTMAACSNVIKREASDTQIDLSGNWNDTDSQQTAKTMIADVLARNWLNNFVRGSGRQPVVIVGSVNNLSSEHINTRTFVAEMERELLNSGKVEFVADKTDRQELRDERADQAVNASEASRNAARNEQGADFMLQGQINTIMDKEDPKIYIYKDQVRYYQINLKLISLKDNRLVWAGQHKIKKLVKTPALR